MAPTLAALDLTTATQADIVKAIRAMPELDQMAKIAITGALALVKPAEFDRLRLTLLEVLAALQQTPRGMRVLEAYGIVEFARRVAPCGCGETAAPSRSA